VVNSRSPLALALALPLLWGCGGTVSLNACPEPLEYSREFQELLLEELIRANSPQLDQLFLDFHNVNQQLRILNE
jgi:hypothetical protein